MQFFLAQAANEPTGGVAGWALDLIDSVGALGLFLLTALDSMTSILPVDMLLPLVGYSATQGGMHIGAAIAAATMGSAVGYLGLYLVGARLGRERARVLVTKIPGIKAEAVDRAEAWFARHGAKAVIFGRMMPGVRCFISIPAGVERMPLPKYVALSALGGLMWNSVLLLCGYLLGENWHRVTDALSYIPYVLGVALVLFAVRYVIKRRGRGGMEQAVAEVVESSSSGRRGGRRQRAAAAIAGFSPVKRLGRRRQGAVAGVVESSPARRRSRRKQRAAAAIVGLPLVRRFGRRKQEAAAAEADREPAEVTQP
ncbi:DedA family protein [Streptomyces sp. NPDC002643]